jgi:hypothetical protein
MPKAKTTEIRPTPPEGMTAFTERDGLLAGRQQGERGKHRMGVHFGNITKYQFYRDLGYQSAEEMVEKMLDGEPNYSSLREWSTVASRFTEDEAAEHTCHKLFHLTTYARVRLIEDLSNPGEVPIEIPDGDEKTVTRPLRECTTTEVERAIARFSTSYPKPPPELYEHAESLQKALGVDLDSSSFAKVNVQRRGRDAVIQIDNLQSDEAELLCTLLRPQL